MPSLYSSFHNSKKYFIVAIIDVCVCVFVCVCVCVCVQLLVAADQLLLQQMKRKCEKVLSEKINAEVAVPMYQAAYHYSAPQLLACSSHYLLALQGDT